MKFIDDDKRAIILADIFESWTKCTRSNEFVEDNRRRYITGNRFLLDVVQRNFFVADVEDEVDEFLESFEVYKPTCCFIRETTTQLRRQVFQSTMIIGCGFWTIDDVTHLQELITLRWSDEPECSKRSQFTEERILRTFEANDENTRCHLIKVCHFFETIQRRLSREIVVRLTICFEVCRDDAACRDCLSCSCVVCQNATRDDVSCSR